jgi:hypothetical protein
MSESSNAFLSIRTSCNRCRIQKLKCIIVSETPSCQRCTRALVPCVFGRRERKRRTTSEDAVVKTSWPQSPSESPPHNLYPDITDGKVGTTDALLLSETEPFPFYDNDPTASAEESLNGESTTMNQLHEGFFSNACQDDSIMGDGELLGYNIPYPAHDQEQVPVTRHEFLPHPLTNDWNSDFGEGDPFTEFPTFPKPKGASTALLQFAANLHERLDALENEPSWRCESARMDDYPIGSVLQLANKLQSLGISLQRDDCSDDSTYGGRPQHSTNTTGLISEHRLSPSETGHTEDLCSSSSTASHRFETSVSLILLSCYVTLLRVSTVVLGHFQEYLLAHPSARPRAPSMIAAQGSVVCLGDLVLLNQSHDRIHTAIYMLVSSLEQVEEALCLPPQVRHASVKQTSDDATGLAGTPFLTKQRTVEQPALVNWGLGSTTGGIRDILSELGRKVKETKEMLRHHMDL